MIIRMVGSQLFSISNLTMAKRGVGRATAIGALLSLGSVFGTATIAQASVLAPTSTFQSASTLAPSSASEPLSESSQSSESSDGEPSAVVATLFDKPITAKDITPNDEVLAEMASQANSSEEQNAMMALASLTKLSELIIEGVLDHYFVQNNLAVDAALVEKFKTKFAGSASEDGISDDVAKRQVMIFLAEKHMYNTYGGEVVFRQSNPQLPVGAYYKMLKNYEQTGKFTILDKGLADGFWTPFTPPYQYELAEDNINFAQPWWL
ncbi:hypothetical protein [Alteromonas sp. P256]|uniref:hypothetical protein n=1 Tax=Alteromonas sp. P256 TaxID=3117399 RepID=UPI002FE19C31